METFILGGEGTTETISTCTYKLMPNDFHKKD